MRRLLVATVAGLLTIGLLAGCNSGDDGVAGKVKVDKDGKHLTVTDGDSSISVGDSELPESFPKDDVPLPSDATLKAVVSGKRTGDEYYSLSYAIASEGVAAAAKAYKTALTHAGYRIQSSASAGAAAAVFSAFTALGPDWDVVVYSGGSSGADGLLALQVTEHAPSKHPTTDGSGASVG